MLEASVDPRIELSESDFQSYVQDDWNWKESWDNDHAWDFFCEGRVVDGKATFFDNNGEEKIVIVNNNHRKIMFLNDNLETVSSDIATLRVTFPYFWDKFVVYNR